MLDNILFMIDLFVNISIVFIFKCHTLYMKYACILGRRPYITLINKL